MSFRPLRLAPVVILVALETAALGNFSCGVAFAMALAAGLDSREENVGGIVAFDGTPMAGNAGHHAMRAMIKFCMS